MADDLRGMTHLVDPGFRATLAGTGTCGSAERKARLLFLERSYPADDLYQYTGAWADAREGMIGEW